MSRPKKPEDKKRIRVNFTTLPKILVHLKKECAFMSVSEYIHRLCVADYNAMHPEDEVRVWKPEDGEESTR